MTVFTPGYQTRYINKQNIRANNAPQIDRDIAMLFFFSGLIHRNILLAFPNPTGYWVLKIKNLGYFIRKLVVYIPEQLKYIKFQPVNNLLNNWRLKRVEWLGATQRYQVDRGI